jgi:hypothetical protein
LVPEATVKKYLSVRKEGIREVKRLLDYYNLDMIISVSYRVKSHEDGTSIRNKETLKNNKHKSFGSIYHYHLKGTDYRSALFIFKLEN